jgi:glycosyltransferase involved in cell wall biosynthesis
MLPQRHEALMRTESERNVLNIAEEFLPFYTGHGIYLIKLHEYLKGLGYRYTIVTPRQLAEVSPFEVIGGIEVHRVEAYRRQRFFKFYTETLRYMISRRHTYRVIHINSFHDRFFLLLLLAKLLGKKVVVQMALLGSDDPLTFVRTFRFGSLRFWIIRKLTDKFFPISTPIEQSCVAAGVPLGKIRKIYQGVDLKRFSPPADLAEKLTLRRRFGLPEEGKLAIFVGAIIERKGVRELLDAWAVVQSHVADSTLVLVGPYAFGEENVNVGALNDFVTDLRKIIEARKLRVVWVGKSDSVELLMAASDVFVFPSRREGFGNVIIEAMACGIPCVVTPMDGVALDTVVSGETGYIAKDVQEVAEKTVKLLSDPRLAASMGARGRETALRRFDFPAIASQYVELYESL